MYYVSVLCGRYVTGSMVVFLYMSAVLGSRGWSFFPGVPLHVGGFRKVVGEWRPG